VSRALDLAEEALRAAEGDEAEVLVHAERSGVARFANSIVHQPTLVDDAMVRIRIVRDGKVGWASTNRAEGLDELAKRAGEAADQARPDPDFPGLTPPAEYEQVSGYDQETAELGPDDQARLAAEAIAAAGDFGLYGYFTSALTQIAHAQESFASLPDVIESDGSGIWTRNVPRGRSRSLPKGC